MKLLRVICLVSLGGLIEGAFQSSRDVPVWGAVFVVSLLGWSGSSVAALAGTAHRGVLSFLSGRPQPRPASDPQALAEEMAALTAQIAQLRDTATAFDLSFDQTLQRLDERLRRVEQQSSYVSIRQSQP